MFSTKTWFVKNSTRIVKYESRVVKSNPVALLPDVQTNDLFCFLRSVTQYTKNSFHVSTLDTFPLFWLNDIWRHAIFAYKSYGVTLIVCLKGERFRSVWCIGYQTWQATKPDILSKTTLLCFRYFHQFSHIMLERLALIFFLF